jgi:hypothetical protein
MSIRAPRHDARPWIALVCFWSWFGNGGCAGSHGGTAGETLSGPPAVVVVPTAPSDSVGTLRPVPPKTCSFELAVYALDKEESCVVQEHVTAEAGLLEYPCGGGPAEVRFREAVFRGEVRNGELELRYEREFRYDDGCRWQSVERIAGPLRGGRLRYSYDDAPLPGQRGCADPCGASALVNVIAPE